MRERRKKQARGNERCRRNKGKRKQGIMRDAEVKKKEASKVKQTTEQSNTAHPMYGVICTDIYYAYSLNQTAQICCANWSSGDALLIMQ